MICYPPLSGFLRVRGKTGSDCRPAPLNSQGASDALSPPASRKPPPFLLLPSCYNVVMAVTAIQNPISKIMDRLLTAGATALDRCRFVEQELWAIAKVSGPDAPPEVQKQATRCC
ncbi:MAG: hypothetical protein HY648_11635 [Acidobacteria bacterium]|nr:hypothetical protein [Acidobacteriota bacterium]